VDAQLTQALADWRNIAEVAVRKTLKPDRNSRFRISIPQGGTPILERTRLLEDHEAL